MDRDWRSDLEDWLAPFLGGLGHKARSRLCPAYVAGLIGSGDRKSIQPIAARDGQVGYDQLHHFIASGVWNAAPLEKVLLAEADKMVGSDDAWLIIDDTALPKKGERSVGVAPQYASSLGKTANCQCLVSVTLASREVPVMVGLRLFLPETWTNDPERMARAHVPKDRQIALTKPEIAIEEIDRIMASGVRFGCVLANSGYGSSGPFRQALSERGLLWAVGLSRRLRPTQKEHEQPVHVQSSPQPAPAWLQPSQAHEPRACGRNRTSRPSAGKARGEGVLNDVRRFP